MTKKHSLCITVATAAFALAYVIFVFLPGQAKIRQLQENFRQQQDYLAQSARLPSVIAELEDEIKECRTFADRWRSVAPSGPRMAEMLGHVTGEAASAGVELLNLHPQPLQSFEMLQEIPLELKLQGSFHRLADFLRRIESLPASLWVREVKVQPTAEDGEVLHCELTLSIFTENNDISD
jgi:type IV pilus assembly protein PilO